MLEYEVGDVEVAGVTRTEGSWFVKNRGHGRFKWECVEELLVGGDGGGGVGHGN